MRKTVPSPVIEDAKKACPRELSSLPPVFTDNDATNRYIHDFVKSKKPFDFYCVPCDGTGSYRAHDLVMGYIARETDILTIDYAKFKDMYILGKGEFIWAFKQVSVFPTVAAQYTPDPIANGRHVYEIRCILAHEKRVDIARNSHMLTPKWCLEYGILDHPKKFGILSCFCM